MDDLRHQIARAVCSGVSGYAWPHGSTDADERERETWYTAADRVLEVLGDVEGTPGAGLCDCDRVDDPPTSPVTGEPMGHHCDCRAVATAAVLLGDRRRTQHAMQCVCGDIEG